MYDDVLHFIINSQKSRPYIYFGEVIQPDSRKIQVGTELGLPTNLFCLIGVFLFYCSVTCFYVTLLVYIGK